ncbi:MAG: cob(I)yrinic acid a,c-diamide adenosyltransferase [Litorivicinus sp.]
MGNRLSKITTRTGDDGTTGLGDGSRINKDDLRMQAIGDVDEFNSFIGVLRSALEDSDPEQELLSAMQHHLFDLGGELAVPGFELVTEKHLSTIESHSERLNAQLPPLKEFILPAGTAAASHCHVARAVARRAERSVVALRARDSGVRAECQQYLNRASDVLFILARSLCRRDGGTEVYWQR